MADTILKPVEINKGVFWVGAVDWAVRQFHGHHYHTTHGTTYNSYLVKGGKTALVDTVHIPFAAEMFARLSDLIDLSKLDYMVVNHV